MKFADTHAHLDVFVKNSTLQTVIERAVEAGVDKIITCSTNSDEWILYESLAKEFSGNIFWQIGIHPSEIKDGDDIALDAIGAFFTSENPPVAIGEIGMDFYHKPADLDEFERIKIRQKEIFLRQLEISKAFENTKICVHARDCVRECISAIEEAGIDFSRVVLHCFSGSKKEICEINERGARASFTGIITYKNADEMRECMLAQGLDKLMFETDCPYLAPAPLRGKTNEPANIPLIAKAAATIFDIPQEKIAQIAYENSCNFFGLK